MDMLSMTLEHESGRPLYEQVYTHIKTAILNDSLTAGTKLPSKRRLGDFLAISQTTVEFAYAQLLAEGYIESIPRKGFYVLHQEELYVRREDIPISPLPERRTYRFDLHPSQIDTRSFPFERWRRHMKQMIDDTHHELLSLGSVQGDFVLRQEIATYLYHSRGVRCSPEQIIIGSGTEQLLPQLLQLFDEQSVFGIEDPGYPLTRQLLRLHQTTFHPIPTDANGIRVDQLKQIKCDALYVTPAHQFPTGAVLSVSRRKKLLNWAIENDAFLIEDDYDGEFRYSGKPIPSLQSMDESGRVIYLSTFSKSLMPSLRIGYMVLPPPLLNQYRKLFQHYTCSVPRFEQHALANFMRQGDFERHLNRMRKNYRRKIELVMQAFKAYDTKIHITGETAGLHIVLSVNDDRTEEELKNLAAQASIRIYGMNDYRSEPSQSRPQLLFGFAGLPDEDIPTAVTALLMSWGVQ